MDKAKIFWAIESHKERAYEDDSGKEIRTSRLFMIITLIALNERIIRAVLLFFLFAESKASK